MEQIGKIAVASAIYAIDNAYSYRIPPDVSLQVGTRVIVPFGRGNRRSEGVVLSMEPMVEGTYKTIEQVLDTTPIISPSMLRLAAWIRSRYFCTMYEAIRGILPAGCWFDTKEFYEISKDHPNWQDEIRRKPEALAVMNLLQDLGGRAEGSALRKAFPKEDELEKSLQYLLQKKVLTCDEAVSARLRDKTEVMVTLAIAPEEAMEYANRCKSKAPLQYQVLQLLSTTGRGNSKEICYFTGCSMTTLKRLQTLGLVALTKEPVAPVTLFPPAKTMSPMALNEEQTQVFDGLSAQMTQEKPGVALLHGVTGSGKTAVYIRLIAKSLELGKTSLVLVPEIALTPQLLGKFSGYFGEKVAVLHSGLTMRSRYDQWKNIADGQATVVVGTRSAVFAPLQNLGLLILDEEQENTYQSENKPRYDAREVAMYRGAKDNALVLFGSATPSMETMYRAKSGVYTLYQLPHRFNGKPLPTAEIVDMKEELRQGNGTNISAPLAAAIQDAHNNGHQSILFLNRRGASRYTICVDCGTAPTCPNCSVNLTYHSANRRHMCHYCGYSQPQTSRCPSCGGHLKEVGFGTQKVQEELTDQFPNLPSLRMDGDTISAANSHEKVLETFQKDKVPLLIGTQMVAKGLDFPNVTLVGVLDGDSALYSQHYRASETAFSMLAQVIGRAGRGEAGGRAILQSMTPEHGVIALAAQQNYEEFYEMEIQLRKLRQVPPFSSLFTIHFSGVFENQVRGCADFFTQVVSATLAQPAYEALQVRVLGPAPEIISRINNQYRYQLTLCSENTKPMRQFLSQVLIYVTKQKQSKGVTTYVDINH